MLVDFGPREGGVPQQIVRSCRAKFESAADNACQLKAVVHIIRCFCFESGGWNRVRQARRQNVPKPQTQPTEGKESSSAFGIISQRAGRGKY